MSAGKRSLVSRFDHLMVFVKDLEEATRLYRDVLGFDIEAGGRHESVGTHNGIIRFGLDYIELISFLDWEEGRNSPMMNDDLREMLETAGCCAVSYCLASGDIEALIGNLEGGEFEILGPIPMERKRPDGKTLKWRLCILGMPFERAPYPFFIQWENPDVERLDWEKPGKHRNGANRVLGMAVCVEDPWLMRGLFETKLGLLPVREEAVTGLDSNRVRYGIGDYFIDLLSPVKKGVVKDTIDELGEGPISITLAVDDLEGTEALLEKNGVGFRANPSTGGGVLIPDESRFGIQFVMTEA